MISNIFRAGNFTSSKISKLMAKSRDGKSFGSPALTYIEERNLERKLGRCVETDGYSKAKAWGLLIERYVFENKLGTEYELLSKKTVVHQKINYWSGSADLVVRGKKVAEIKCYEPKNFATYVDALLTENVNIIRDECPEEYWQMVSNAILNNVPNAEAIVFMPYQSELMTIREYASNYDGADQWKYRYITESEDNQLPYLPDNGYYKDLNRFVFEVPKSDIKLLTETVLKAGEKLIDRNSFMLCTHDKEVDATIVTQDENALII